MARPLREEKAKVFPIIPDKNGMERDSLQLLNFIVFFGIIVTITTAIALPTLDWGDERKVEPVVKEEKLKYKIPKRLSFNH